MERTKKNQEGGRMKKQMEEEYQIENEEGIGRGERFPPATGNKVLALAEGDGVDGRLEAREEDLQGPGLAVVHVDVVVLAAGDGPGTLRWNLRGEMNKALGEL